MEMNKIGAGAYTYTPTTKAEPKTEEKSTQTVQSEATAAQQTQKKQDTFERTSENKPITYSKQSNKLSSSQLDQIRGEQEQRLESFRQLLQGMIVKQGQKSNLSLFGKDLFVSPADSAKAAASIADGGEYSVNAVATRLLDMAKALSGGDPSKIGVLRDAVEKGFKAAGVELGGKLPGICNDTYTEVMKRFDDWENEGKSVDEIA